jgi:glycine cleavage system H protein
MDYIFLDELKYTQTHEWVRIDGDYGIIGITDYAQHQLGDIVYVEFPEVGLILERESNACEIESVKAVGDLLMPLSGEIVEINQKLVDSPELVNSSPFDEGWIIKIRITHNDEIADLLSATRYKELVKSEER